jgi:hypothetical protein
VPATPEIGDAGTEVGKVKIFWEIKSQENSTATGNVYIAAEIEIELQTVGNYANHKSPLPARSKLPKHKSTKIPILSARSAFLTAPQAISQSPSVNWSSTGKL